MATDSVTDVCTPFQPLLDHGVPGRLTAAMIACAVCLGAMTLAQEGDPENRLLEIRVVDRQSRTPIEGVQVKIETDTGARDGFGGDPQLLSRLITDKDGSCRIEFPRVLPKRIYVVARQPGYAVRNYAPLAETGGPTIPRRHTMELERGITIGGVVKSRDGRPVPGATVIDHVPSRC